MNVRKLLILPVLFVLTSALSLAQSPITINVYPGNCGPGDGSGNFRCVGMPLASYPDNAWINWLPSQPSHFIQVSDSAQTVAFTAYDLLRVDNGSGPAVFTFTVTDGVGHLVYNGVATIAYHTYRGCTSGRGAHCGPYLAQDGGTITLTPPPAHAALHGQCWSTVSESFDDGAICMAKAFVSEGHYENLVIYSTPTSITLSRRSDGWVFETARLDVDSDGNFPGGSIDPTINPDGSLTGTITL